MFNSRRFRSLRKGPSGVYLQYTVGGETIGANRFEVEIIGDIAYLRFSLRPVNDNQRSDEEHLHTEKLEIVQIHDDLVTKGFSDFLDTHSDKFEGIGLAIHSKGKLLSFRANPAPFGAAGMQLRVQGTEPQSTD